ncbi:MAG: hypothetical protein IKZ87_05885, partial [Actinomycetaceae bacterium]|nr:hypothetical protein [Actinomycetaceae bacterium]
YDGRDWGLEIIGFFNTSAYNTSVYRPINTSGSGREEYVQRIMSMADPQRGGVVVGRSDGLLLMSTCASDETNSRTVVVARITEETYPDTFVEEKNTGSGLSDDRGWFGIPQLAWVLFFIALAAFIGIFIVQKVRDEKKKQLSSRESVNPAPSLRGTSEASGEAISSEPISTSPPSPFNSPAMTDVEQVLSKEEV